jgi:predicted RNA binding protein YcfA (HicA-like mRNA interferase family)
MTAAHPAAGLLRNVPIRRIVQALERDGFAYTERQGSQRIYRHSDGRRVVIHYHRATDTLPPYVIRNLLAGTSLSEADLRRLKLIR